MKVLITAGGTSEPIDAIRTIKNDATGKLGMLIAHEFLTIYADIEIYYLHDAKAYTPIDKRVHNYRVETVADLESTMKHLLQTQEIDTVIHSMAVSDYKTEVALSSEMLQGIFEQWNISNTEQMTYADFENELAHVSYNSNQKLGSKSERLFVSLTKTPKIIEQIKLWNPRVKLVGFKLLHNVTKDELIDVAYQQLLKNNEVLVVANDKQDIDGEAHRAFIIDANKKYQVCTTKQEIASNLVKQLHHL